MNLCHGSLRKEETMTLFEHLALQHDPSPEWVDSVEQKIRFRGPTRPRNSRKLRLTGMVGTAVGLAAVGLVLVGIPMGGTRQGRGQMV